MISYDFSNRVAVVTGGAQGIGGAVATMLAANGAHVAIWDLDRELAESHAARIGKAAAVHCDIADWPRWRLRWRRRRANSIRSTSS